MPLASGVQALAVDNLLYNLSVAIFISTGACVMLLTYDLPPAAHFPLVVIAAGMALVIVLVGAAVVSDVMPVTAAVDFFIRRDMKRGWFESKREHFHHVEENVYDFYKHRPAAFFTMFACDFLAHATTVFDRVPEPSAHDPGSELLPFHRERVTTCGPAHSGNIPKIRRSFFG